MTKLPTAHTLSGDVRRGVRPYRWAAATAGQMAPLGTGRELGEGRAQVAKRSSRAGGSTAKRVSFGFLAASGRVRKAPANTGQTAPEWVYCT